MSDSSKDQKSAYLQDHRFSLREMMEEVKVERLESHFGRQLVDSTEIEKMFDKRKRKKKSK